MQLSLTQVKGMQVDFVHGIYDEVRQIYFLVDIGRVDTRFPERINQA